MMRTIELWWLRLRLNISRWRCVTLRVLCVHRAEQARREAELIVKVNTEPHKLCKVKVKVAHTRLPSVGFWSWSRFLAVSLQVTWVINPAVGCHYFPPGLQLPSQPLRGLLPILLLGEQRHDGFEQFASQLRFKPRPFCAWVQHANHLATEPPSTVKVKVNGIQQLATSLTATGTHAPCGITQCYLPPGRGDRLTSSDKTLGYYLQFHQTALGNCYGLKLPKCW